MPPSTVETAATHRAEGRQVALFFRCWAVVVFYDRAVRGTNDSAWSVAIVLAATAVVLWPESLAAVTALSAVHLTWYLQGYTARADMHWHVAALLHLAVVTWVVGTLVRQRRVPRVGDMHGALAPVARWLVVVGLFSAGFAKLNTGFLDPSTSCAVDMFLYQRTAFPYSLLPDAPWAYRAAMGLTLVSEMGSPLLLLWRRTRPAGFVLGFTFLFIIGTNPVGYLFEFAGLFLAMSLFFAAPDTIGRGLDEVGRFLPTGWLPKKTGSRGRAALTAALVACALVLALGWGRLDMRDLRLEVCRVVFVVGVLALSLVLVAGRGRWPARALPLAPQPRILLLVPLIFLLGELTPYIGLKHAPTMTMAANLAVSSEFDNHLLVHPIPRWSFNRVVTIRSSSDKHLERGTRMVWLAFADYLAEHPRISVEFEVEGKVEQVARAGEDPRFQHPSMLPELLHLDDVRYPRASPKCSHRFPR
jgi:hypothetical protein